jgi:hypothetical protein
MALSLGRSTPDACRDDIVERTYVTLATLKAQLGGCLHSHLWGAPHELAREVPGGSRGGLECFQRVWDSLRFSNTDFFLNVATNVAVSYRSCPSPEVLTGFMLSSSSGTSFSIASKIHKF